GLTMTGRRFADLFGGPRREPESDLTQREMDLARSVQAVTEDVVLNMARHVRNETDERRLVMAGGVALNCVANGELVRSGIFDEVWFQPAAGDAGGALGAAYAAWHLSEGRDRTREPSDSMQGAYLGPSFTSDEAAAELESRGLTYARLSTAALIDRVAELLADGKTVGWFRGRMEFGPRALGNRSVLADPRGRQVQRTVNLKIKYRESFRPFAPSVLEEQAFEWFDLDTASPYMLIVADVDGARVEGQGLERLRRIESRIPAVTHVDGSARIQTVSARTNPHYHALLSAFERLTACPVLVNTSFNVRGEPIVCTPSDAVDCFLATHLDVLALEDCLVLKSDIPDANQDLLTAEEAAARYGLD
ncbi:MAG: hypothetical protein HKN17_00750, partial [Rhodothermales bacterium]|nr:hypothetical protein [Rhodothermales bacterium]